MANTSAPSPAPPAQFEARLGKRLASEDTWLAAERGRSHGLLFSLVAIGQIRLRRIDGERLLVPNWTNLMLKVP